MLENKEAVADLLLYATNSINTLHELGLQVLELPADDPRAIRARVLMREGESIIRKGLSANLTLLEQLGQRVAEYLSGPPDAADDRQQFMAMFKDPAVGSSYWNQGHRTIQEIARAFGTGYLEYQVKDGVRV